MSKLEFSNLIFKFPCLSLALDAARKGGSYPAALNAADENCSKRLLEGQILFTDIPKLVSATLKHHKSDGKTITLGAAVEVDGQGKGAGIAYHQAVQKKLWHPQHARVKCNCYNIKSA